ncbi:hemin uptake protein HemP [Bradyrhizobium sp. AZCC 2230]|uniref:hemin uptake protein HemP n=1 Tax=Bradyrhizobium sp. AZCC 2230 TaxID=3117021 RepID=UPI002FF34663
MVDKSFEDNRPDSEQLAARAPRTVTSRDLLGGERLLVIQHEEEVYRLQLTAAGKLILTK